MRAGRSYSHLISFASGHPDANLSWTLSTPSGTLVTSGSVTPGATDVSTVITISGTHNSLGVGELIGARELAWSYTVGGQTHGGEFRYTLEAPIPFAVTFDGVRNKLGVSNVELPDPDINLFAAYLTYRGQVTAAVLDVLEDSVDLNQILISDAIEATAALAILPTLQVRLAQRESSGTNQFARANIDWNAIDARLRAYVSAANASIAPVASVDIFMLTSPDVDPVTGA